MPNLNTSLNTVANELSDFIFCKTTQNKIASVLIAPSDFPSKNLDFANQSGAIYQIRTIGGLVTPAQGLSDLSIGATLEYGIRILNAKHIFQISHTDCAFIKGLIDPQNPDSKLLALGDFLPKLLTHAGNAISGSLLSLQKEGGKRYLVEELLRVGFENLMTYPWIVDKVWGNQLELHGCYIDNHTDTLKIFSPITDEFEDFNPE